MTRLKIDVGIGCDDEAFTWLWLWLWLCRLLSGRSVNIYLIKPHSLLKHDISSVEE